MREFMRYKKDLKNIIVIKFSKYLFIQKLGLIQNLSIYL